MMPARQIFFSVSIAAYILCGDPLLFKENSAEFKSAPDARPHINKSASRRFYVYGKDPIVTQRLAGLCENLAGAFEKYLNLKVNSPSGAFRLYLQSGNEIDSGYCRTSVEDNGDRFCFTIVIVNVDNLENIDIVRCVVRQLLNFMIYERLPPARSKELLHKPATTVLPEPAPVWMTEGVVGNVLPGTASKAAMDVLPRWKRGELAGIDDLIAVSDSKPTDGQPQIQVDSAAVTLFLDWVKDWDKGGLIPDKLLSLYAGKSVVTSDDLLTLNPSLKSRNDLVSRWDKYLLSRSRSVLEPGKLDSESLDNFVNQLVLYPGTMGIPADVDVGKEEFLLDDLIAMKKQDWIGDFARGKRVALFLISAGRGDEIKSLASAYGAFLEALADRSSDRKLKKLLAAAREEHERVTSLMYPSQADGD